MSFERINDPKRTLLGETLIKHYIPSIKSDGTTAVPTIPGPV